MNRDSEPTDSDKIVDRLLDEETYPSEVHGTQLRTQSYGGDGSKKITVEIWENPWHKSRLEVQRTETVGEFDPEVQIDENATLNQLEGGGHVVIRNENELLKYNRDTNRCHSYVFETSEELAGSMVEPSLIGSSPKRNFEISRGGVEEVVDRETHVLRFEPREDAEQFYRQYRYVQIWVDSEYWLPMKHEAEYRLDDCVLTETNEFQSVEFDSGIDDSVFDFEPPEEAEIVSTTDCIGTESETRSE
ncbi:LolA family protein [Halorussus aquaticus]|uniref:Outer membrane lipoprotein carrier protein LolA n=1 Tax=Halorussus aquaticus TaxID=2953748 RepID=A0ABD5PZU0_9EURY|nr:DUF2092 domain-containing protein [Halorussus aquaticus]